MIRILLYQLFFILLINAWAISQDTRPSVLHYTMKDGLSQMKTNSIAKDSTGYMWIGTRNGLNRFDGQNIVNYSTESGLPHDRIHDVLVNNQGQVIILTYRGISVFDGIQFSNYLWDFLNAEYHMYLDPLDRVWILTHDETFLFASDTLQSFDDLALTSVVTDTDKRETYCLSQSKVYLFKDGQFEVIGQGNFDPMINHLHSNDRFLFYEKTGGHEDRLMCYFKNGVKHCLTRKADYYNINPDVAFFKVLPNGSFVGESKERSVTFEASDFIRIVDAFKDQTGNFWLADENGFSVILNSPFSHYPYRELPYVWTINQDKNGHFLAGSFGYGLMFSPDGADFKPSLDVVRTTKSPYYLASSVTDHRGNVYLAHGQGIVRWDGSRFDLWLRNQPVYALAFDPKNYKLYAGSSGRVIALDTNGIIVSEINTENGLHPNEYIQNLSIDDQGQIWAGSYTGLSYLSQDLTSSRNFIESENTLPCAGVFCSYTDKGEITWLGGDHGLMYYNRRDDTIVTIQSHVLNSMVKSVDRLDHHHLLIGSKDGLYIFNEKQFKENGHIDIHVFNTSNGYQGLEPGFTGFYEDGQHNIWICSASSVDVLRKQDYSKYKSNLIPRIDKVNGQSLSLKKTDRLIEIEPGVSNVLLTVNAIGLIRPSNVKFQWQLDEGQWSKWTSENQLC